MTCVKERITAVLNFTDVEAFKRVPVSLATESDFRVFYLYIDILLTVASKIN